MSTPPDPLSPEDHERIRQDIRQDALAGTEPRSRPRAVLLSGQPGAGKTGLSKGAEREFDGHGGAVVVDADSLRARHPRHWDHMRADDRTAAERTHPDAAQWADELVADARDGRRNIVVDGTLKNTDRAEALSRDLRAHGYEVEVRAMAVAKEDAELGVERRYWAAKERAGAGRWVPPEVQDAAREGQEQTLRRLERGGAVECISVYRRGNPPERVYENAEAWRGGWEGAANALVAERERPRSPHELDDRALIKREINETRKRVQEAGAMKKEQAQRAGEERDQVQQDDTGRSQGAEERDRARQDEADRAQLAEERDAPKPDDRSKLSKTHERDR